MAAKRISTCRECGIDISDKRQGAVFCSAEHRKAWNNRRMIRGAEVYDLLMANRYEREKSTALGVWSIATNLLRAYRDSDRKLRDGRQSWNLRETLDRLPIAYSDEGDRR
jgi:hypothetical protein